MAKILIVYNNDSSVLLHDFFESCGDEVRQCCCDCQVDYTPIVPPDMTEGNVMQAMENHQVCFIAGHGYADGICDEKDEDVVSTRTTNYNLQDKAFYSVSCLCGINLCPSLMQIGAKLFVGYNDAFIVNGNYTPFLESSLSGIKSLINGETAQVAKDKMYRVYDEQIEEAYDNADVFTALHLLHNKESLVFEGDMNYQL